MGGQPEADSLVSLGKATGEAGAKRGENDMRRIALTAIFSGVITLTAFGQVNQRRENQQDRIAQGVQSGQLTAGETANLENKERGLNGEISADRKANGGTLTQAERQRINGQQNRLSNNIYADKHNAASDHFGNSKVGLRQENQQDRIAQGIRSGKLNAGQTANLESREAGLNHEVRADRQANGGKLTGAERKQVNQQQNHLSKAIYRNKH